MAGLTDILAALQHGGEPQGNIANLPSMVPGLGGSAGVGLSPEIMQLLQQLQVGGTVGMPPTGAVPGLPAGGTSALQPRPIGQNAAQGAQPGGQGRPIR